MITKKVCLLGTNAVGKTSMARRFVDSLFSEEYHTSIGVKIDKKVVQANGEDVSLVLWDIHGEDGYQKIPDSYFRGMAGYILVVDGSRPNTLDMALQLRQRVIQVASELPYVLALNKADLVQDWDALEQQLGPCGDSAVDILKTSAKTGVGVEETFMQLSNALVRRNAA